MARLVLFGLVALGCACSPSPAKQVVNPTKEKPASSVPAPATSSAPPREDCIVVGDDAHEVTVDGTVESVETRDRPQLLRLTRPRCVRGLGGVGFITEVQIASAEFDIRSLVGARIKATGTAAASAGDVAAALVLLVTRVERVPRDDKDEP